MKYLSSEPFTIAVSMPREKSFFDTTNVEREREAQKERASKPHEFSGGTMCGVCGLDDKAKIHCRHPFESRMVEFETKIVDGEQVRRTARHFCGLCDAVVTTGVSIPTSKQALEGK